MGGWGHFVADGKPGLAAPVEAYQVGGTDGSLLRALLTDSSGRLYVIPVGGGGGPAFNVQDVADGTPGSPAPALAIQIAGTDGTNLRALLTDTTGQLKTLIENTPAVTITGTLPAFAAEPTVKIDGSSGSLPPYASTPAFTISGSLPSPAAPSNSNSGGNVSSLHVKSSAGTFYGLTGYSSIQQYLQLLDTNSLSSGSTVPAVVLQVGPGSFAFDYQPSGRSFATGIFAAFSSTETVFTTGTAGWLDAQYV